MLHVYVRAIRTVGAMRFRLFLVLGVEVFGFFLERWGRSLTTLGMESTDGIT